jgi:hypothetical protein
MIGKSKCLIGMLATATALAASPVRADETFVVCIGQYEKLCPTKRAWFPCGTPQEEAGRSVCTVYTAKGQTVRPFKILRVRDIPGNRCGYLILEITCLDNVSKSMPKERVAR